MDIKQNSIKHDAFPLLRDKQNSFAYNTDW